MNTDDYEGHTPAPWRISDEEIEVEGWAEVSSGPWRVCVLTELAKRDDPDVKLIADAPDLLADNKRLHKALQIITTMYEIEQEIVQAFYEYREDCCFDHCEAWMLEKGHRVMVRVPDDDEGEMQSEWKAEVDR